MKIDPFICHYFKSQTSDFSVENQGNNQFVELIAMSQDETRNGCKQLVINYAFHASPVGELLIASTGKGICFLALVDSKQVAVEDMTGRFPNATFQEEKDDKQVNALSIFSHPTTIQLHVKGTPFQFAVWKELLTIPEGRLVSYSDLALQTGNPKAVRATGTAVGDNPVSIIIPCHRVLRSSGELGGYHWGLERKIALIRREIKIV